MRVIVGITGASGAIYGIRLLQEMKKYEVETHLVISKWAEKTISIETSYTVEQVAALGSVYYSENNLGAAISSGSFPSQGMVIVPCSMKTIAAVSHGYSDNLINRAADVTIKERRKLILVPRETPLSPIHLKNMLDIANLGAVVMPPMPAFYTMPQNLDDIINQTVGRILDQLDISNSLVNRWSN
ncbi:MAG: UbiX family flavin prenyltransferase [Desulfitobacteriaceae bacterium]|nr:UbiX family flavin prenyltransferase [Desulfitobacteriaceae bacterium]MDD4752164.1 UbiX family flavin prenyltransferase [Desulfitobacteriaceae bacterium]